MLCLKWNRFWNVGWGVTRCPQLKKSGSSCKTVLQVEAGQTYSFKAPTGLQLRCESGVVWLTQSGNKIDYVLCAGDIWQAKSCGRVVIQAMESKPVELWVDEVGLALRRF